MNKATIKLADFVADRLDKVEPKTLAVSIYRIMEKGKKLRELPELIKLIEQKYDLLKGRKVVEITTARSLTPDEIDKIKKVLSKKIGGDVKLNLFLSEKLIGGIKIKYPDDEVVDLTTKNKLKKLREKLAGTL